MILRPISETLAPAELPALVHVPPHPIRRRIMLVEEHPIACKGLAGLINHEDDLTLCGVADDSTAAVQKLEILNPDLMLLGTVSNPDRELDLLRTVRHRFPNLRILIVSTHDETLFAPKALRGGASGYVMKREPTGTLLTAIRRVLDGKTYMSDRLRAELREHACTTGLRPLQDPIDSLTPRERELFSLFGRGKTLDEIAQELGISVKTVHTHRTRIKEKLNLGSIAHLVQAAGEFCRGA